MKKPLIAIATIFAAGLLAGCGGSNTEAEGETAAPPQSMVADEISTADFYDGKGVGPISSVELADVDEALAASGKEVFDAKCTACHKADKKFIGPSPAGIMERRTPEWIMNMILNPEKMVEQDQVAKQLLIEYNGAPMANQNLTEDEARSVLEYFRTLN